MHYWVLIEQDDFLSGHKFHSIGQPQVQQLALHNKSFVPGDEGKTPPPPFRVQLCFYAYHFFAINLFRKTACNPGALRPLPDLNFFITKWHAITQETPILFQCSF